MDEANRTRDRGVCTGWTGGSLGLAGLHKERTIVIDSLKPTGISEKVEYVKEQGQTRPHTCHWPNCNKQVPPAMWGCKTHWYKLPKNLRDRVWATYRPGQEVNMTPSPTYLAVAKQVDEWIREYIKLNGAR